ncbi:MAG TPA: metallophosphoesterase [Bacilli bacterium]|jgi:curved DNA-binding protein CbpA|nr:MAG: hypothetical protein BWX94_01023 [Tenericutes bacterium ADurb.Bin140]HOR95891.1 metallophosphoesterase [Bacilli bacterium]
MKGKRLIIAGILSLVIIGVVLALVLVKPTKFTVLYANGQMGLATSKKLDKVEIDSQEVSLYQTVFGEIELCYESLYLDNSYDNQIILNQKKVLPLQSAKEELGSYVQNKVKILGLNVVDGLLSIDFRSGQRLSDNYNTFSLRNIYLKIGNEEIWSDEFGKDEYFNESLNFGENNQNPDYRFNYRLSRVLTFTVRPDLLDCSGTLLDGNSLGENFTVKYQNKTFDYANESLVKVECNISEGQAVSDTMLLNVTKDDSVISLTVKMDGLAIPSTLLLSKNAWAEGDHVLEIEAKNKHGFSLNRLISFKLAEQPVNLSEVNYDIYQIGVTDRLYNGIEQLGTKTSDLKDLTGSLGEGYLEVGYCEYPVITFVVEKGPKTYFSWVGQVPAGRTAFMQIFNFAKGIWETVSTKLSEKEESIQLGFDYQGIADYEKENKIYFRVSSAFTDYAKILATHQIFHWTDIQYIVRTLAASAPGSYMYRRAEQCLNEVVQFIIDEYRNNNLAYLAYTGDMVQQQVWGNEDEWTSFVDFVLEPLLSANVPLGVSSGNHDVGGVSSYQSEGSNGLDSALTYEYFGKYAGEDLFKNLPYYGGSFENNRSHYDLITVNGHEFLFLYLGWGSSIPNIHVSSKDINWAKGILEQYPDKTVVLATHEYMGNKSNRSLTGNQVFNELVKKYPNIQFVISGHINGSSYQIDKIDDDGDGIYDRRVLQILTDFQEEESLFGASFLRTIGLDFVNNYLHFNIYSPYFKDYDIFVNDNKEYVKASSEFYYAFDLTGSGYGLITDYFG